MMLNSVSRCSAMLFFLAITTSSCWGTIYNPAADFEQGWITQSNPNGVWSYGYSSGFTNPITLYVQTVQNGVNGPNALYWLSPSVDVGTSPAAEFNAGPAYNNGNVDFSADEFLLVAGIGGQYSDLVFTAPAAGIYSIEASFLGSQYGIGTVVGIVANGNVLFNSSVTAVGQTVPFNTEVSLTAGKTVVFSVGPGSGSQNTGLSLIITPMAEIPEPSSLALLGTGIIALLGFRQLGNQGREGRHRQSPCHAVGASALNENSNSFFSSAASGFGLTGEVDLFGVDVQIVLRVAILPPGGLDQRGHSAAQMPGLAFIPATTVSSGAILFRSSHKRGRRILGALRGAPPPIVRACSVVYRYCRISFRLQLPPDDAVVR